MLETLLFALKLLALPVSAVSLCPVLFEFVVCAVRRALQMRRRSGPSVSIPLVCTTNPRTVIRPEVAPCHAARSILV